MASTVPAKLDECVVVYDPSDGNSDKISTKLSSTVTEVAASLGASNSGTKITKVSCASSTEEKRQAKQTSGSLRNVATIFVITEEILEGDARRFLEEMMRAVSGSENARMLTVYYKVKRDSLPGILKVHECLDYEASDFKKDVATILTGKVCIQFLKACCDGNVALVRRFIQIRRQVLLERDAFGNNCLYWAIMSNNLDLFTLLLDEKADFSNKNKNKETLLHVACMLGHSKFIPVLRTRCKLSMTAMCSNKRTPLERVAENGDIESLKELKAERMNLTACTLPYAAAKGRLPFLRFVLEESDKPIQIDSTQNENMVRTALMKACEMGQGEVVDYLLSKGVPVNVEDSRGRTPLHVACENGHEGIVEVLIQHEAELDVQDCYTGAMDCFLVAGTDQGRKAWQYVEVRRNVVHIFKQKNRAGQVDVAKYGTVVKSGWGEDPGRANVAQVEKLFSDRLVTSPSDDLTPLHVAIYKQHPKVARLLIEKGANINIKDHFGLTLFMLCALRNDRDTAALLEEKGANVQEKDNVGHTAMAIANMNEQEEMIDYIAITLAQAYVSGPLQAAEVALRAVEQLYERSTEATDFYRDITDIVLASTRSSNSLQHDLGAGPIMQETSRPGIASNMEDPSLALLDLVSIRADADASADGHTTDAYVDAVDADYM